MSTKKTEERKEVNPKETEVWTVHANNPRKHELNRACITTRHPCVRIINLGPTTLPSDKRIDYGRDYRVSLLVSIVRDGDVNFCRDSSRADVSPPRIEWRSNRWRVLRARSERIFAACCSSTPIIIPLIVPDGIDSSRDEFAAERWLFFGKVGEMVIFEERRIVGCIDLDAFSKTRVARFWRGYSCRSNVFNYWN